MQDLFLIIKSMSSAEKRLFALQSKIYETTSESKYLPLFDAYNKLEVYDDTIAKAYLKNSALLKRYAPAKTELFNLILRFLRNHLDEQDTEYADEIAILNLKILKNRGLNGRLRKEIEQVKKQIEKNQVPKTYLSEVNLIHSKYPPKNEYNERAIFDEMVFNNDIHYANQYILYRTFHYHLVRLGALDAFPHYKLTEIDTNWLKTISKNPPFIHIKDIEHTPYARRYFLFNYMLNRLEANFDKSKYWADTLRRYTEANQLPNLMILISLNYQFESRIHLHEIQDIQKIISMISSLSLKDTYQNVNRQFTVQLYKLIVYIIQKKYTELKAINIYYTSNSEEIERVVGEEHAMIFENTLSCAFLLAKQYDYAIFWIKKLLGRSKKQLPFLIEMNIRILYMCYLIENDLRDIYHTEFRNWKRWIDKQGTYKIHHDLSKMFLEIGKCMGPEKSIAKAVSHWKQIRKQIHKRDISYNGTFYLVDIYFLDRDV